MLQRAASNACSWWWASHIRTKQSKWLEQSLQDMEEKVQSMLKLIEEDGDSFAKRAEMYYKRRPELIGSVEEAYRAFRALADRYDLLSKELQNANHTIATVFPEQVQFAMDEDDDCPTPKPKNSQLSPLNMPSVPKVPKVPLEDLKGLITTATKKFKVKKSSKAEKSHSKPVVKSGLSKDEALEQIDKLQKEILALQTVKEFVKSSYESGLAKYWEFENQIMDMQEKVCRLQDEFDVEMVIDDNEARALMAEAALKSCQETLTLLEEKQEKSTREAKEEFNKIESARQLLESLRRECMKGQPDEQKPHEDEKNARSEIPSKDVSDLIEEIEKSNKSPKFNSVGPSSSSLTVTELADKIDELVNKVISLETAVSSQTVLIDTLRTEADDLHAQIRSLEDEKETLIDDTHNLSARVKEMEEKLKRLEALNKNVESHNSSLQTNFAEARSSLDHLSDKLSSVKPDEEIEKLDEETLGPSSSKDEIKDQKEVLVHCDKEEVKEVDVNVMVSEALSVPEKEEVKMPVKKKVTFVEPKEKEEVHVAVDHECNNVDNIEGDGEGENLKEEELDWQQMLLSVSDDREKTLLKEYTTILRNYKEVKKKLVDTEKSSRDSQFDITVQMRELQRAIQKRDQEIQHLRQKLNSNDENEDFDDVPNEDDEIKLVFIDDTFSISAVEEKLRKDIDAIVDENLNFWLRFSTAFHQVQKFKSETQDLTDEILKLKDKKKNEGGSITAQLKSEARPIYKHLREIQTELTVWLEQSVNLKEELKRRSSTFCSIQEEITKSLNEGVDEDEIKFSSHQAARLQGEIMNMKQENNKVRDELEVGIDQISGLQVEIEKTLMKLNEEFGISSDQPQLQHNMTRAKVPLRSFIFGTKQELLELKIVRFL
ncbi:hypothetical protein BUALT_Bualt11G0024800 [Buddleja alternifolia]|uniref:NAB domain-containing protein n=1 Tax=Buddleja alternifolia TaxID=168488 RepID=A0AAV6WTA7_9LAMI|nr:hypothetical protein BUALT_Bualt11G0024800 [Buddleja alternifolia]